MPKTIDPDHYQACNWTKKYNLHTYVMSATFVTGKKYSKPIF